MNLRMTCALAISLLSSVWLGYNDAAAATLLSAGQICDQSRCRPEPRARAIRITGSQGHRRDIDARFWVRISAYLNCCQPPAQRFYGYAYGPEMSLVPFPRHFHLIQLGKG